jgi:hypothetical protein
VGKSRQLTNRGAGKSNMMIALAEEFIRRFLQHVLPKLSMHPAQSCATTDGLVEGDVELVRHQLAILLINLYSFLQA